LTKKEKLEQTSILMVLTMALLQTKTDNFRFQLLQQETKYLVSFLVYETSKTTINVADFQNKTIVLLESSNTLDAVVISAGTMETGDKARAPS
jgi:hypothetical protein